MRDTSLLTMRPTIELLPASKKEEEFQNQVLRPILKLQNPITLQFLKASNFFETTLLYVDKQKVEKELRALFQKDRELRNQVLGIIIGMMTEAEFAIYSSQRKEYNKRILSMQLARYADHLRQE